MPVQVSSLFQKDLRMFTSINEVILTQNRALCQLQSSDNN